MKAALLLCLLIALSRAASLKQFLKSEPDSDLLYLVYIDTYNANRCSPSNLRTYETLTENGLPENMRAISFTDQESQDFIEALGVVASDLPAYRLIKNSILYKASYSEGMSLEQLTQDTNLELVMEIALPLTRWELIAFPLQSSHYFFILRGVLGRPLGVDWPLLLGALLIAGLMLICVGACLVLYVKSHAWEPLSRRHVLRIAGLWVVLKILLMPGKRKDFGFHHWWKILASKYPVSKFYSIHVCLDFDYPPLFMVMEGFWGWVASFFFAEDMRIESIAHESPAFLVFVRLTVIVGDLGFLLALIALFTTVARSLPAKEVPLRLNVASFTICLFEAAFLVVDNVRTQYNSVVFTIVLMSLTALLRGQVLVAAFLHCVILLFKHVSVYYSGAYFSYLLFCYCLTSPDLSIRWANLLKLGAVVLSTFAVVLAPFRSQFSDMLFFLSGGYHEQIGYPPPNMQFLYSLSQIFLEANYTKKYLLAPSVKLLLIAGSYALLFRLVWKERQFARFPFYLFCSGLALYNFMDYVHQKHILFLLLPLLVLGLQKGGADLQLALEFKLLVAWISLNQLRQFDMLLMKYPFLYATFLAGRLFIRHPSFSRKFLFILVVEVTFDIGKHLFDVQVSFRYVFAAVVAQILFFRILRHNLPRKS